MAAATLSPALLRGAARHRVPRGAVGAATRSCMSGVEEPVGAPQRPQYTFRARVAYDGTAFFGLQRQPRPVERSRTVAAALEGALCRLFSCDVESLQLCAAGRTDSGVHASGQVVSFLTPKPLRAGGEAALRLSVNALLPEDVRVLSLQAAPTGFSPRFDAVGKRYTYTVDNSPVCDPLLRRHAFHEHRSLDLPALRAAAAMLLGEHDFSAFANVSTDTRDPIRLVTRAEIQVVPSESDGEDGDGTPERRLLRFHVEGSGFLYKQVRNMVGALLRVGTGSMRVDGMAEMLAVNARPAALKAAPAHGLCLARVFYPHDRGVPPQLVEYKARREREWQSALQERRVPTRSLWGAQKGEDDDDE